MLEVRQDLRRERGFGHSQKAVPFPGVFVHLSAEGLEAVGGEMAEVRDGLGGAFGRDHEALLVGGRPHLGHGQQFPGQGVFLDQRPVPVEMLGAGEESVAQGVKSFFHGIEGVSGAGQNPELEDFMERLLQGVSRGRNVEPKIAGKEPLNVHAVFRQGARFVHAENRDGAQGLHRGHAPGQDAPLGKSPGAQGKKNREDNGKFVRHEGHRQAEAREDAGQPGAPPKTGHQNHRRAKNGSHDGDHFHQGGHFDLQGAKARLGGFQGPADFSDFRGGPDAGDAHEALPLDHEGPGEYVRRSVPRRGRGFARNRRADLFPNRNGFPRQQGLVHGQVGGGEKNPVGRDTVSLGQHQQVAANNVAPGHAPLGPVPNHERPGAR